MPNGNDRPPDLGGARFIIWFALLMFFGWLLYVLNEELGGSLWPFW